MKNKKHEKQKFKIIEKYSVLFFVAALFMCIGFAGITDQILNIKGEANAVAQDGVFITDVSYASNSGADITNSKLNYYLGTVLDSQIKLGNNNNSSITYEITIYNSTEKEQLFVGALTDSSLPNSYTNQNIEFTLNGIEKNVTTLAPKESITFSITFKYKQNAPTIDGILKSIINFRFLEKPILVLSNENQTYTLNDIYPDFTPAEYQFTVSNYSGNSINNVPLTYSLETQIASPLSAKIYDESGNEVTGNISIDGNGATKTAHTYTLKILWDDTNEELGVEYNDLKYINQTIECLVNLKAVPTGDNSEKYSTYTINKQFNVNILTAPFYFDAKTNVTEYEYKQGSLNINVIISNNNGTNYNLFNTNYELSITGNNKFAITGTSSGNIIGNSLIDKTVSITVAPNNINNLNSTEKFTIKVRSTSPYVKEIEIPIIVNVIKDWDIECYGFTSCTINDSNEGKSATVSILPKSNSNEKINLPLKNLEVGSYYQLTFTNALQGISLQTSTNSVYGSTVMPQKATATTSDSKISNAGKNSGFLWKSETGEEETVTLTFKATQETMYWIWDFSKVVNGSQGKFILKDVSIEKTVLTSQTYVDMPNTTIFQKDSAGDLVNSQGTFKIKASYEDLVVKMQTVGGVEHINIPLKGLTIGKTYKLSFTNYTPAIGSTAWQYGTKVQQNKQEEDATNITNSDFIIKDLSVPNSGTITFTTTAETMYWTWQCAGIKDEQWATINIYNVVLTEQ